MAVSFFPFNSIVVNGVADRAANAENLAAYLAGFFSDGVIMQDDTALQVAVDSGMNLQILAGTGNIKGKTILNTTAASITIEAASATLKRIDRVIFRLDENNRLMEFDVLKGTAASSPTAPALTRSGGIYEMCLAEVLVPAGATSILASYITDTRSDSSKCGIASIPPHMQDIAHGGTGKTTAAEAMRNLGVLDYVVEYGTTSPWTYAKYKSGWSKAWCRNNVKLTNGYFRIQSPFGSLKGKHVECYCGQYYAGSSVGFLVAYPEQRESELTDELLIYVRNSSGSTPADAVYNIPILLIVK